MNLTKEDIQKRVTRNGTPIPLDDFYWNSETKRFSVEYLIRDNVNVTCQLNINFEDIDDCSISCFNAVIIAGNNCRIKAGGNSKVIAKDNADISVNEYSTVITGDNSKITTSFNCMIRTGKNSEVAGTWRNIIDVGKNSTVSILGSGYVNVDMGCKINVRRHEDELIAALQQVIPRWEFTTIGSTKIRHWNNIELYYEDGLKIDEEGNVTVNKHYQ